jgi:hypothetical protein
MRAALAEALPNKTKEKALLSLSELSRFTSYGDPPSDFSLPRPSRNTTSYPLFQFVE